jgi:sortase A
LDSVGLNEEKITIVPENIPGWYNLGVKPGETGNAVIVGHTPGIFSRINELSTGDTIDVTDNSHNHYVYKISKLVWYKTTQFPIEAVYGQADGRHLNLITCSGDDYRLVVFSELE